jgi:energy-coupling factor transport system permease protein
MTLSATEVAPAARKWRKRRGRVLHPAAWWLWAAAMATVAMRTTNPVVLAALAAVLAYVVAARRTDAPWARSFGAFLKLGLVVVVLRVMLQVIVGQRLPGHTIVTLPSVDLPDWAAGVSLGGPVTIEAVAAAVYDGLRLAVVLAAFGAANSLANPYRLLRCLPGALYEAGVAVTVAVSFAPEAIATVGRISEARRLRGRPTRGLAGLRGLGLPVLEGALQRSVDLAASMDARGYGRRAAVGAAAARTATAATVAGMLALFLASYGLLDSASPGAIGLPALALGVTLLAAGLVAGGRRAIRSRYRPDPWRAAEWIVVVTAVAAVVAVVAAGRIDPGSLRPSTNPLATPAVPLLAIVAAAAGLVPLTVTDEPS